MTNMKREASSSDFSVDLRENKVPHKQEQEVTRNTPLTTPILDYRSRCLMSAVGRCERALERLFQSLESKTGNSGKDSEAFSADEGLLTIVGVMEVSMEHLDRLASRVDIVSEQLERIIGEFGLVPQGTVKDWIEEYGE